MPKYDPEAAVTEFERKFCDRILDICGNLAYREFKSEEDADDAIYWLEKVLLAAYRAGKREAWGKAVETLVGLDSRDNGCYGTCEKAVKDAARADGVEL